MRTSVIVGVSEQIRQLHRLLRLVWHLAGADHTAKARLVQRHTQVGMGIWLVGVGDAACVYPVVIARSLVGQDEFAAAARVSRLGCN